MLIFLNFYPMNGSTKFNKNVQIDNIIKNFITFGVVLQAPRIFFTAMLIAKAKHIKADASIHLNSPLLSDKYLE